MDKLNQRQIKLLKLLISDNSYKAIKTFANKLEVSNKTIFSDLKVIESSTEKIGVTIERKTGSGIKLLYDDSQLLELVEVVNDQNNHNNGISVEQRRADIARSLLLHSKEYTTIQKLSDKYYVSRTSILNDLEYIEEKLSEFNIKIIRTRDGTRISGREVDIRQALVYVLQENINYNSYYLVEYQILRDSEKNIEGISEGVEITFFKNLLNDLEKDIKRIIYEPYYTNLLTHLLIMTKRIKEGNNLEDIRGSKYNITKINSKIYKSALIIVNKIEDHYSINISDNEIFYIYQYLTSIGLSNNTEQSEKHNDEFDITSTMFTRQLISVVSTISGINFNNKLFKSLVLHIKPMINRLNSRIKIKNPLLEEIRKEFSELFFITRIACNIVCEMLEIKNINLDEIAYIMTYFQNEIEKGKSNLNKKVLVICHSGYGSSQVLATRLRRSFSNIDVVDIISSNKLDSVNLDNIDLIVSTIKLNLDKPYMLVSAFLSEVDIKNIQNLLNDQSKVKGNKPKDKFKEASLDKVEEYKDEKKLISKIKKDRSIDINKDEIICLDDITCIYLSKISRNSTFLYSGIKNKNKNLYLIEYKGYDYLILKLRDIISTYNKNYYKELVD
ncbi:transcription antiterminator [Clostridium sp. D2Q-14]|uniref:BglG family transcription antiterminator n=1 Tax=Anaeromonas gelatinilytica TaxID=2683194 RepID=UPI00193B7D6F|nr:transcription antiterminator [Anaeromonas gelatinilytica]MBS4535640.1 transcription antiterminator [Anaeromonas gelatinilytica]